MEASGIASPYLQVARNETMQTARKQILCLLGYSAKLYKNLGGFQERYHPVTMGTSVLCMVHGVCWRVPILQTSFAYIYTMIPETVAPYEYTSIPQILLCFGPTVTKIFHTFPRPPSDKGPIIS